MRAFLICLLLPLSAAANPVEVKGTLLTHEGKAPVVGIVRVTSLSRTGIEWGGNSTNPPSDPHLVDADGRFSFTLQTPGLYALWFEAPQHEGALVPLWLDDADRTARSMTVQLAEAAPPRLGAILSVAYKEAGKERREPLTRQADGTWTFSGPSASASIRYSLEALLPNGTEWFFNPSEPKVSTQTPEGKTYLASLGTVKDGTFSVRFDPKDLPKGAPCGRATVKLSDPTDARLYAVLDEFHSGFVKLNVEYRPPLDKSFEEAWREVERRAIPALWPEVQNRQAPVKMRAVAAVLLLQLLQKATPDETQLLKSLAPPESLAWAVWPLAHGAYYSHTLLTRDETLRWLGEMSRKNPDREVQGGALATLAKIEEDAGHASTAAAMFRRISIEYADLPGLGLELGQQRKTFPLMGKAFPAIELADLNGKRPDANAFKGRFTLVDFSATGCGACTELTPELRQLRDAVPAGSLRMITVTFGVNDEQYRKLLAEQPPETWDHYAVPGERTEILDRWNVSYYPTLYLVGPDGVVVATDRMLRGGKPLGETVRSFLSHP